MLLLVVLEVVFELGPGCQRRHLDSIYLESIKLSLGAGQVCAFSCAFSFSFLFPGLFFCFLFRRFVLGQRTEEEESKIMERRSGLLPSSVVADVGGCVDEGENVSAREGRKSNMILRIGAFGEGGCLLFMSSTIIVIFLLLAK